MEETNKQEQSEHHVALDIVNFHKAFECQTEKRDLVGLEIVLSNKALVSSMIEKMETMSPSLCIYKVAENILKNNEKAYMPSEVAIGPFHHGKEDLKSMEGHKWCYFRALLSRKPNMEPSLNECVKAVRELEPRARKCYDGCIGLSSDDFVQIMIVDGCFIIELFLKYTIKSLKSRADPVFSEQGKLFSLRRDLILLENQIPFFVLQNLFNVAPVPKQCGKRLIELAFGFFKVLFTGDEVVLLNKFTQPGNHLLDFVRNCYLPSVARVPSNPNVVQRTIHSAERLQESGVKFKRKMANSLLDIEFVSGILKMPTIPIHHYTDSVFRNLIALEQCSLDSTRYITSYAFLMGGLIQSPRDVQLLRRSGIIGNCFNSDEEVSLGFKRLCEEVSIKDFYYAGMCEQVNAYRTNRWVWLKCPHIYRKIAWPCLRS